MMSPDFRYAIMYRLMLEKNHSIDWKNGSFVFNNKNKEVLHMIDSALN